MPTTRPRHTITETPPVNRALDELRAQMRETSTGLYTGLREDRIDFAELVILGAQAKAERLRNESAATREARERLLDEVLHGTSPVDLKAAEEVKHLGLIANYE